MFQTQPPLRLVRRYAGDIASFMQFLLVNFLNECAFVLCPAITQLPMALEPVEHAFQNANATYAARRASGKR
jgi:hypothetical protein